MSSAKFYNLILVNQNTVISNKIKVQISYLNFQKNIPVITISKNKIPGL